jgi:nitrogen fixation NifU-like protein
MIDDELRELYREVILEHSKHPQNFAEMQDADHKADGFNPLCGDQITVFLKGTGERVDEVSFQSSACAICTASASLMTDVVEGKTETQVKELFQRFHGLVTGTEQPNLDDDDLGELSALAGVSHFPVRVKCATLPWHTLQAAFDDREQAITTE